MIQQADEDITEGCIGTRWGPISKTVPRPDENAKISQFSGASPPGTPNMVILGPIAGRTESPDPMKFFLNLSVYGGGGLRPLDPFPEPVLAHGGPKAAPRHLAFDMCNTNSWLRHFDTSPHKLSKTKGKKLEPGFRPLNSALSTLAPRPITLCI